MGRRSREGGGLVQWFFWAQKSWLVVMPGLCLNNIRPITFSEGITHREPGSVMPTNKTTSKTSPTITAGRTSTKTTTPAEKKLDVPSEPLLDFQTTLPEDFYAPSVWEAHQALVTSNDESALAWPGYQPNEEAWSHFTQFLLQLHLEDLRRALATSAMLMGHPVVFDQIWHFYRMSRMETVESLAESENAMPHLLARDEQGAAYNPGFITAQAREQVRDALQQLCQSFIGTVLPGCLVERRKSRPPRGRPFHTEREFDDEGRPLTVPTYLKMIGEYEQLCDEFAAVFREFPTVPSGGKKKKKRFWKWDEFKEEKTDLVQRMGKFLQAVHAASTLECLELTTIEEDVSADLETRRDEYDRRHPLKRIQIPLPLDPATPLYHLHDLLEDTPAPSVQQLKAWARLWNSTTSFEKKPLPSTEIEAMIDYALRNGHTVNPRYLVFALCGYYRGVNAEVIRGKVRNHKITVSKRLFDSLLYPSS